MDLYEAFYLYFVPTLVSTCTGVAASGLVITSLWRSCRRLNLRVIDLEQAHLQLRNKGYAQKRWSNQEQLEAELATLGIDKTPAKRQKFDNDPLEY